MVKKIIITIMIVTLLSALLVYAKEKEEKTKIKDLERTTLKDDEKNKLKIYYSDKIKNKEVVDYQTDGTHVVINLNDGSRIITHIDNFNEKKK